MGLCLEKLKNEIKIEVEKGLFLLDQEFEETKSNLIFQYEDSIGESLDRIYDLQQCKKISLLGSISFVLSRVEISNENYKYYIVLSGEKQYVVYMLRDIFQTNKIISQIDKLKRTNTFVIIQNEMNGQPYYIYGNETLT